MSTSIKISLTPTPTKKNSPSVSPPYSPMQSRNNSTSVGEDKLIHDDEQENRHGLNEPTSKWFSCFSNCGHGHSHGGLDALDDPQDKSDRWTKFNSQAERLANLTDNFNWGAYGLASLTPRNSRGGTSWLWYYVLGGVTAFTSILAASAHSHMHTNFQDQECKHSTDNNQPNQRDTNSNEIGISSILNPNLQNTYMRRLTVKERLTLVSDFFAHIGEDAGPISTFISNLLSATGNTPSQRTNIAIQVSAIIFGSSGAVGDVRTCYKNFLSPSPQQNLELNSLSAGDFYFSAEAVRYDADWITLLGVASNLVSTLLSAFAVGSSCFFEDYETDSTSLALGSTFGALFALCSLLSVKIEYTKGKLHQLPPSDIKKLQKLAKNKNAELSKFQKISLLSNWFATASSYTGSLLNFIIGCMLMGDKRLGQVEKMGLTVLFTFLSLAATVAPSRTAYNLLSMENELNSYRGGSLITEEPQENDEIT